MFSSMEARYAPTTLLSLLLLCSAASAAAATACPSAPRATTPRPYFPPKTAPPNPFCPRDTLKLGVCLTLLGVDVGRLVAVGDPYGRSKCCALLEGLTDAEAAACLCTTIKESVLGITTEWSVALSVLVSSCKKEIPDGFKCV